ncbi:hypothetical protein IWQ62_000390 [Dispira parvispora]|uniref:Uncharacterized protein n=1 Tax=Dispira parvispora TaxID=1520584 RepID=A0A9W8B094_9FUNG|nr:hypothetical protein IWQ62_000390 [Dispira parvispora]
MSIHNYPTARSQPPSALPESQHSSSSHPVPPIPSAKISNAALPTFRSPQGPVAVAPLKDASSHSQSVTTPLSRPSMRKARSSGMALSSASLTVDKIKEQRRLSRQRSVLRHSKDADFYAQIENTLNYKDRDPKKYLDYLKQTHPKSELGALLARKDGFHETLLQTYMASLDFADQPVDLALRKLLGELHLPKETQQIDRIILGFAKRYHESNPNLFTSVDAVYSLAFSLMLLHTDAHNVHVKQKMTKEQYFKMAKSMDTSCHFPEELLSILYDNVTYVQFCYADQIDVDSKESTGVTSGKSDPAMPVNSGNTPRQNGKIPTPTTIASSSTTPLASTNYHSVRPSTSSSTSSVSTLGNLAKRLHLGSTSTTHIPMAGNEKGALCAAGGTNIARSQSHMPSSGSGLSWVKNKLMGRSRSLASSNPRPVALMQQVTNAMLSPKLGAYVPAQSPYSYHSTQSILRDTIMRGVFKMNVPMVRPYLHAVGHRPQLAIANHSHAEKTGPSVTVLRCTKEGFLVRKVDILENGKRAPVRNWKDFWVVLSGSQLVLFRNIDWFRNPKNRMPLGGSHRDPSSGGGEDDVAGHSPASPFSLNPFSFGRDHNVKYASPPPKPHTVIPTMNGVCVLDSDYTKYPYVFRFVAGDGRQYLFRASSDDDVDDWMAKINYTAAFKTLEVATRGAAAPTITVDSDTWSNHWDSSESRTAGYPSPGRYHTSSRNGGGIARPLAASPTVPQSNSLSRATGATLANPEQPFADQSTVPQRDPNRVTYNQLSFSPPDSPQANNQSLPDSSGDHHESLRPSPAPSQVPASASSPPATHRVTRSATAPSYQSTPMDIQASILLGTSQQKVGRSSHDALHDRVAIFSRRNILREKINELEACITDLKNDLQQDLRLHRQLAIMIPFQKTTRQRATTVIDNLRQKIKKQYLNLQKFECYQEILETDLQIEIELSQGEWD